jgi:hypothetical protein
MLGEILNYSPFTTIGSFLGHEIEVSLDFKKISLYIDGKKIDSSRVYLWPKRDAILLRGAITAGEREHAVHVYGKTGLLRGSVKICVNGRRIAGDDF